MESPPNDPVARWRWRFATANDRTLQRDHAAELAFWEQRAEHYEAHSLARRLPALVERVVSLAGPPGRLLDLGCGVGSFALPLAAAGHHITAVDQSPAMLAVFRRRLSGAKLVIRLVQARIEQLLTTPHDVVLAANALYRIADPAPVLAAIHRWARRRVIVVWSVGRPPAWKVAAREQIAPGRYRPGPDYHDLLAVLWSLGCRPTVEMFWHPVEARYPDVPSAAAALLDWEQPTAEEQRMAEEVAVTLFERRGNALVRPSHETVALLHWEPPA